MNELAAVASLRLNDSDIARLDTLAAYHGTTRSEVLRDLLRDRCAAIIRGERSYNNSYHRVGAFTRRGDQSDSHRTENAEQVYRTAYGGRQL